MLQALATGHKHFCRFSTASKNSVRHGCDKKDGPEPLAWRQKSRRRLNTSRRNPNKRTGLQTCTTPSPARCDLVASPFPSPSTPLSAARFRPATCTFSLPPPWLLSRTVVIPIEGPA